MKIKNVSRWLFWWTIKSSNWRRGQNVRLASILWMGHWYSNRSRRIRATARRIQNTFYSFHWFIDIDDVIAHLLVAEGFISVEEIAESEIQDLAHIEGFDEAIAEELRNRAISFSQAQEEVSISNAKSWGCWLPGWFRWDYAPFDGHTGRK